MNKWIVHLNDCLTCARAIRMRFAGGTVAQIERACCEQGKPIFRNFVKEANEFGEALHNVKELHSMY